MCGICGIFHADNKQVDHARIKKMADVMYRRGPDGEGFFIQGKIGLGHRRLAIIDLETGDQPLFNEDKSVTIVFNGEIYNYQSLTRELKNLGHQFSTKSDTEVIVHAYEQWGTDCVTRFNGMWAFAIWDAKKQGLFISRDRIGEKPLVFYQKDKSFYFASEIKGLLASGVAAEPDTQLIAVYLALGYVPAPYTFYKNIKRLLPGHSLWIDASGKKDLCYWKLPQPKAHEMERDEKKAGSIFRDLFSDAVQIRMHADVPFGAFLSGGLDSSAIVTMMSGVSGFPVSTFTIGFREKEFDERYLAQLVSQSCHTNHYEKEMANNDFLQNIEQILTCYDEPFGDSSAIPTGAVSEFAKTKVKMVLTGDGGDEVLSGYPSYQAEKALSFYLYVPGPFRKILRGCWDLFRNVSFGGLRYTWNRFHRLLFTAELPFVSRLAEKTFLFPPGLLQKLVAGCGPQIDPVEFLSDRMNGSSFNDPFYQLMYFHFSTMLPDDMLAKVDRMSMYHSLETRLPFLDFRLVEFAAGLHKNVKMQGLQRKSLLRNTLGKSLPKQLLQAPKKGFAIPHREWFKQKTFIPFLDSLLSLEKRGFDNNLLSSLFLEHTTGKKDYGQLIWSISLLKQWITNL
ncbi:MAG: asparagine synthase (glutamine-hydrolyzing) [Spirochaetales bacterium]|nr:asparagine synthase (glutamine-hydrolyzing) [Spirochaetales bacterium]